MLLIPLYISCVQSITSFHEAYEAKTGRLIAGPPQSEEVLHIDAIQKSEPKHMTFMHQPGAQNR